MTSSKRKLIAVFIPSITILNWSLFTMINSFDSNETWRIALSSCGFLIFLALMTYMVRELLKKQN